MRFFFPRQRVSSSTLRRALQPLNHKQEERWKDLFRQAVRAPWEGSGIEGHLPKASQTKPRYTSGLIYSSAETGALPQSTARYSCRACCCRGLLQEQRGSLLLFWYPRADPQNPANSAIYTSSPPPTRVLLTFPNPIANQVSIRHNCLA